MNVFATKTPTFLFFIQKVLTERCFFHLSKAKLTLNSPSKIVSKMHQIVLLRTYTCIVGPALFFLLWTQIRDSVIFIALFKSIYLPNGTANRETDDGIVLSSRKYHNILSSKKCADARGARYAKPEVNTEETLERERVKIERWDQHHSIRLDIPHLLIRHSTTQRHFRPARETS